MPPSAPPYSIVVPTIYGRMIVNRNDVHRGDALIKTGRAPDHGEIQMLLACLELCGGEGMVIDAGANVGTHTLAFAQAIGERREVQAFEAQRIVFQMLAGNAALNCLGNVHCHNIALGDQAGRIEIPQYDYDRPLNFGAVEFGGPQREPLHQARGDDPARADFVQLATLDSFGFDPVALIKIDVEGMEMRLLDGAAETIARCRPILYVEYKKVDPAALRARIEAWDYAVYFNNENYLCIPAELADKVPVIVGPGA